MSLLKKIQRNFRIKPSEELISLWKDVATKACNKGFIFYHHFKLQLLTIEEVAHYPTKDIRFWFRLRPKHHLVRYYIPIASHSYSNRAPFVMGYDEHKNYLGIFLCTLENDPVFITKNLTEFIAGHESPPNDIDFLKEYVSNGVIKKFAFIEPYEEPENYEDYVEKTPEETKAQQEEKLLDAIDFIITRSSIVNYEEKLELDKQEDYFALHFKSVDDKPGPVRHSIHIPRDYEYDLSTVIRPILDLVNHRMQNSDSNMIAEYGFYLFKDGFLILHIEQLVEFVRRGVIPAAHNVTMPSIIYSTKSYPFKGILDYEISIFETQEEYNAYMKAFDSIPFLSKFEVHATEKNDIQAIADFFLDASESKLESENIDENKIPSEEELITQIEADVKAINEEKNKFYISWHGYNKPIGHCHFEKIIPGKEVFWQFFYWNISFRQESVIDMFLVESMKIIQRIYNPTIIYCEPDATDEYRIEVLKRAGFEFVENYEGSRTPFGITSSIHLMKREMSKPLD